MEPPHLGCYEGLDGCFECGDLFESEAQGCEVAGVAGAGADAAEGAIERAIERGIARGIVMERFENFQVSQRGVIEREKVIALIERDSCQVFYITAQILRQIVQSTARRADGGGFVFEAEAVERGDF